MSFLKHLPARDPEYLKWVRAIHPFLGGERKAWPYITYKYGAQIGRGTFFGTATEFHLFLDSRSWP